MRPILEICVDEPASVVAAVAGGADRLELCAALALGGLTPSPALLTTARSLVGGVAIRAIVRPRAANFSYDAAEEALAINEARDLIAAGADGLVFGAARNGMLDAALLERWVTAVRAERPDIALTLHRAIDVVDDPVAATRVAADLGFDTILTSGGAASALYGVATIAEMVAVGGIAIMAGSGVRPDNAAALLATGVAAIHASASVAVHEADTRVSELGFATPTRRRTDEAIVRALRSAIDGETA